ncbi:glycosyltransferase family 2 protein [Frankia sp. AgB32]|uniref:glycosyltransferase family 2 protein n=1 Tax=Frankia sp. AgB32 TaxID=631119 RepID=UPI00200BF3D0|nr:galactosyltransferase-related protein [Frankia sp. AgB32]MCK9895381.1 glycosyltransferase family 2 protein [Frankia sp. AgB32]
MHSLLAVVVSHGGSTHLHHLLSGLAAIRGCQVTLVENGPLAGPPVPAGVRVIEGQGNVGYGTAVNLAVREAVESGTPAHWLLVVNSDVTIPDDTAEVLPKLLSWYPPSIDVVGFPFLATPGGVAARSQAVLPTPRTSAFIALRGETAALARWPRLRYPVGAFFAVRMETFVRLGGFDPAFWMYYEETDLFARLHAAGGRIAWADEEWPVVHVGGETVGRSGLLHAELGRAAALYARRHRLNVGWSWPAVHAGQLGLLTVRKLATGRPHDALRAARILAGLAGGLARPAWEPAVRSRWRAVAAPAREGIGRLPARSLPVAFASTGPRAEAGRPGAAGAETAASRVAVPARPQPPFGAARSEAAWPAEAARSGSRAASTAGPDSPAGIGDTRSR